MQKFDESQLEQAIIELFIKNEYDYQCGDTIHRKYDEIILEDDLKTFTLSKYPNLTEVELSKIINRIKLIPNDPLYSINKETFYLVNEGFDLMRDNNEELPIHIDYIDFEEPKNNLFKVVNQFNVEGGHERIPDLLIFVNGIPIAIFEFKSAIREDTTLYDAWKQIQIVKSLILCKIVMSYTGPFIGASFLSVH